MKFAILLLVCASVLHIGTSRPKGQSKQEPQLTPIACNDSQVEAAADLSLRQLNSNRKEGFAFGLKRISDAQEQFDEEHGSVFYITLDVLDTECHVLSRKLWKECQGKPRHEAVFGQCKVIFQLSKAKRIAQLHSYDCTLQPAARDDIGCVGCHFSQPLNDPAYAEIAKKSLDKYNQESNLNKYFVLGNITKAASQVVAGTAYHVEYSIHESSCNKSVKDLSQCKPQDCEFAHTGYCKSVAIAHWSAPDDKNVTSVLCDIFEPEAAVVEEQKHTDGETLTESGKKDHHGKKGDKGKGKKHGQKHGHGHEHKHDHKHGHEHKHDHSHSESHEQEHVHDHEHLHNYEHHHGPSKNGHGPQTGPQKPTGTITYHNGGEVPSDPKGQDKKGGKPPKRGDFFVGRGKLLAPFIRPFPDNASPSQQCPGKPQNLPKEEDTLVIEAPQDPTTIPK
ncbi:fetuin-B-like [Hyperolius riggenbachi]|uniref:fetuin-B-like n=1 Tax=Hyperolius riggenbachi TaxID=752182 RepID=UPI0035A3CBF0